MFDSNKFIKRKDSIVLTAIEILNELGIQGLSTREIAKRQEISEGTLFKHFVNKNEIILSSFENLALYDQDIEESIKNKNLESKEAVLYYFRRYLEYYESYPAITSLLFSYESFKSEPLLEQKLNEIILHRKAYLLTIIDEGKMANQIKQNIDSSIIVNTIIGTIAEIILTWRINNFKQGLKEEALATLMFLLEVFYS